TASAACRARSGSTCTKAFSAPFLASTALRHSSRTAVAFSSPRRTASAISTTVRTRLTLTSHPMSEVGDGEFLADAQNPALTSDELARMADPAKPDRLAWNAFRTLALWESDVWIPRLLDVGLDVPNPLSEQEWSGASV